MYYQIIRPDGKVFDGSAKKPKWVDESSVMFKQSGIKSFMGNLSRLTDTNTLGDVPYEELAVVTVCVQHSNATPIGEFVKPVKKLPNATPTD